MDSLNADPRRITSELTVEQRRELVARIAESEPFRRAPRLREFLLFVCHQSLANPHAQLSEYEIGYQVFKRRESFNPAEDSIVRSSARQLRQKLAEYFQTVGLSEEWVLDIPKGTYVPSFTRRASPAVPPAAEGDPAQTPAPESARFYRHLTVLVVLALLMAAVLSIAYGLWPRPAKIVRTEPDNLLAWLFSGVDQPVSVVLPDAALNIVNSDRDRMLTLEQYLRDEEQSQAAGGAAVPSQPAAGPGILRGRLITGFRDVLFLERLRMLASRAGVEIQTRHSRLMNLRDFRNGNFIVVGDAFSNPWASLFQQQVNFRFEQQGRGLFGIRNQEPRSGELAYYTSMIDPSRDGVSYATVAIRPNLSATGLVLLAAGLHVEGNEGKFDALLSPEVFQSIRGLIDGVPPRRAIGLELLLEVRAKRGIAGQVKLLAARSPQS